MRCSVRAAAVHRMLAMQQRSGTHQFSASASRTRRGTTPRGHNLVKHIFGYWAPCCLQQSVHIRLHTTCAKLVNFAASRETLHARHGCIRARLLRGTLRHRRANRLYNGVLGRCCAVLCAWYPGPGFVTNAKHLRALRHNFLISAPFASNQVSFDSLLHARTDCRGPLCPSTHLRDVVCAQASRWWSREQTGCRLPLHYSSGKWSQDPAGRLLDWEVRRGRGRFLSAT